MAARPRRSIVILATFAMVALLLIVSQWQDRRSHSLEETFPYGELRIAVDASNPPFAVATADDVYGLEIDLGKALGEQLGIPVRFVNMTFDGLYDSLITDQVDILIASLTIDPLRTEDVLYTRHYFNAGLVLVSPSGSSINTMADLSGHSLAYEFGSEADALARRWLRRIAPFETQPYELPDHALDAVRLGIAGAALVDVTSARLHLRQHGWQANITYITNNWYPVAVPAGEVARWQMIDRALQKLDDNGTLTEIIEKWL